MWEYLSTELPLCCAQCKYNSWRELPQRVSSAFFLPPPPPNFVFFVLWWWYSVIENGQIKTVLLCSSEGLQWWCDNTIFPLCGLVVCHWHSRFCFIGRRQSSRQRGSAGYTVNLAPVEICSLWNELCGPVSAEKSQWLTLHPIRAFRNVEWSDSLGSSSGTNYTTSKWKLSDLLHLQSTPLFTVVNRYSYTSTPASVLLCLCAVCSSGVILLLCPLHLNFPSVLGGRLLLVVERRDHN